MNNTLIKRTSIMANESLPSLLKRLVNLNCYNPYSTLTQLIREKSCSGDRVEFPRQGVTYWEIAELTDIPLLMLHRSSAHYFAEILTPPESMIDFLNLDEHPLPLLSQAYAAKQLRPLHASQFCPKCLSDAAYHRLTWLPIAVSACLRHRCLLVSRCPTCKSNVSVGSIVEAQCSKCGADLALAEATDLYDDEWGILSQRFIQTWLMQEAVIHPKMISLPDETPRVLYRIVDGLQWATRILAPTDWPHLHSVQSVHSEIKRYQRDEIRNITPYESYCLYATACKGIILWPRGFWDFLQSYSAHGGKIKSANSGPKADLGNLYTQWLQEYWQHPAFAFVHKAFEEYFIRHYPLSSAVIRTNIYQRNTGIAEQLAYINVSEAARLFKITPRTIDALVKAGQLSYQISTPPSKRQYRLLLREEVKGMRDQWNEEVSRAEAAEWLGTTQQMVIDLVKVGLLCAERDPAEGYSYWTFSKIALIECLEKIARHVNNNPSQERAEQSSFINLIAASQRLFMLGLNAASILLRVAEGKLQAYHFASQKLELRFLLFYHHDIEQCVHTVKAENGWIGREELTKRLQIKDATLARWVKGGLISPVKAGGNAQYFDHFLVEKFIADYVTTEKAAKILGVGKLTVQKWARQGRLAGTCVSGPGIDGSHAYLFETEKLLQWKAERLTFGQAAQLLGVSGSTLHCWVDRGKVIPLNDMGGQQRWFSTQDILELRKNFARI